MATANRKATSLEDFGAPKAPTLDASERAFWIGLITVVLSLISGLTTYLILTGMTPITPRDEIVVLALLINITLILTMIGILVWQAIQLLRAWRAKVPGARLHVRIVALFSLIATLPAIVLALAATTTFSKAIDSWFTTRTRVIIENSLQVAREYLAEHGDVIRTDAANMARDINADSEDLQKNANIFKKLLIAQAALRDLNSAFILGPEGGLLLSAFDDKDGQNFISPPQSAILEAESGHVAIIKSLEHARIAALTRLNNFPGKYLLVVRGVSSKVMAHLQRTEQSVDEYNILRQARGGLKLAHGLMYAMISMTALLAAIWTGLWFTGRFVSPIRRLIAGAQEISKGNLDVELPEKRGEGDLRRLSSTFNTMTRELKTQRDALVSTNAQLSERRSFIEAVLAGVSSGIIGLDKEKKITLVSKAAEKLIEIKEDTLVGKKISEVLPDLAKILETKNEPPLKSKGSQQVTFSVGANERTFSVRVTEEKSTSGEIGSVLTFDDITDLLVAQRTSAWGDVARRIAHEIKNPLTPIILSAERLRRKYGQLISHDRDTFDKLTATIERQASDIKTMVDEFAAFARVPKPNIEEGDLKDAVLEPVILFRESHPEISYSLTLPETVTKSHFDRRLMTQVLTNLIKNATESVESAHQSGQIEKGSVRTSLDVYKDTIEIKIADNGLGLPKQNRARLLEPYVTTKGSKGTGLGLAIVQKILEQHGGVLYLEDAPPDENSKSGAQVRIVLPREKDVKIFQNPVSQDKAFSSEERFEVTTLLN